MRTVVFLFCLLGVAEALAQAPASRDEPPALPAIAAFGVEMGKPLRVMRGERLLKGRLVDVDERSFTLLDPSNSQPERVLLSDVQQLSILKPSPGRGALVGGGVGFLAGVVLGTWFYSFASDYSTVLESLSFGAVVGAVLSLPGAGVGALIGQSVLHWEQVYDRKPLPHPRGPLTPPVSRLPGRGKTWVITFDVGALLFSRAPSRPEL